MAQYRVPHPDLAALHDSVCGSAQHTDATGRLESTNTQVRKRLPVGIAAVACSMTWPLLVNSRWAAAVCIKLAVQFTLHSKIDAHSCCPSMHQLPLHRMPLHKPESRSNSSGRSQCHVTITRHTTTPAAAQQLQAAQRQQHSPTANMNDHMTVVLYRQQVDPWQNKTSCYAMTRHET